LKYDGTDKQHDFLGDFTMKSIFKFCLPAAVALILSSCGTTVNQTGTVQISEQGGINQVIESHSGFRAKISIADMKSGFAGDLLRAQVTLRNDSGDHQKFQYKFKWLDKDGFEVSADSRPWTPISIRPHELKNIQAVAPNPSVKAFKIMVQN
jgi:uncharacterized protein YcfL